MFFESLDLINLSTMAPHVLPQALSTGLENDVYNLYMIHKYGRVSCTTFLPSFFGSTTNYIYVFNILDTLEGAPFINPNLFRGILSCNYDIV